MNFQLTVFSPLGFFFCYAIPIAIAIDYEDYIFVNLENSDIEVKDLRAVLDKRGLLHHDFIEESEFITALKESGPLTIGELKMARNLNPDSILSDYNIEELLDDITFVGDVPENVLNSKDELWLIRIDPNTAESSTNILEETVWRRLITMLGSFKVRFGRFDCNEAADYCASKSWNSPTLAFVVPRLHNAIQTAEKAEAYILKPIKNADNQWVYEVDSVTKQVYALLDGKLVRYLPTQKDFDTFLSPTVECSVHFILLTNLRQCPFLLSALAAKFNYDVHCFAYGPKTIVGSTPDVPDNQAGAIYVVKSPYKNFYYYYGSAWQIKLNRGSTAEDDMLNVMVTFDSLSRLLKKYLTIKTKTPKVENKKPSEKAKSTPPPPKNTYSKSTSRESSLNNGFDFSGYSFDFSSIYSYVVRTSFTIIAGAFAICAVGCIVGMLGIGVICIGAAFYAFILSLRGDNSESRRTEEFARYLEYMNNRNRSNELNILRNLILQEVQNEASYLLRSATTSFPRLKNNEEFSLRSVDYLIVRSLRILYMTDWHKQVFVRFNFYRMVSQKMRTLLAHYGVDVEEIGFPPYNWILRLPAVEICDLPKDIRMPKCPICQHSIANDDDDLCRLPCYCKDIVYHYDCIAPWLIRREDQRSHSIMSGKLHTERPCPTCRFDVTNWGLRQLFNH